MCEYYKNYYIYSTCRDPAEHFIRSDYDGTIDDSTCKESPHDRYIIVMGLCILCSEAR